MSVVGVLALQGAFQEHLQYLARAARSGPLEDHEFEFVAVRTEHELGRCDALVVPGGESTSMSLIAQRCGMLEPLRQFAAQKPVWGTCAGLIFLAAQIANGRPHQQALGAMDVCVARNAFGRQMDSFDATCDFSAFTRSRDGFFPSLSAFSAVFIRAPVVSAVRAGPDMVRVGPATAAAATAVTVSHPCHNAAPVHILHALDSGLVVAVQQGHLLGTSFHPELSGDASFHGWWLHDFVKNRRS